jgi:hypothetical protein
MLSGSTRPGLEGSRLAGSRLEGTSHAALPRPVLSNCNRRLAGGCQSDSARKETAAWVEGGETPRPPLEQSGSRPDGGGGRHRPAASSRDKARCVPAEVHHYFKGLGLLVRSQAFKVEIEVAFLK